MSNRATFKDYVTRHCREKLLNAVAAFIAKKYSPTPVALADITVQSAKAGALNELGVSFVMLVGATIRHTDTPEPAPRETVCLQMEGQVDLAQGPESLEITAVSQRTEMNVTYNQLLSDRLLPVIPKVDLDRVADWMLRHYYPEALGEPMPVNPYVFAERMGAAVEERHLSHDSSVFGRIYFDDADSGIKAGTIYVDPEANYSYRGGNTATSIIHECVHWGLHRRAFAFRRLLSDSAPDLGCVSDSVGAKGQGSDISLMEWQANALAPRIQMPLGTFRRQAEATIARLRQEAPAEDLLGIIEQVIDELARIYHVSRLAAKIRMVEAGYEEAIGTYIYIDDRYVAPHLVRRELLSHNQTYCIGLRDAVRLSVTDAKFKKATANGLYAYVDTHFVLFAPKYVFTDGAGHLHLTNYANRHMEECCLLFRFSFGAAAYDDYQIAQLSLDSRRRDGDPDKVPTYTPVFAAQNSGGGQLSISLSDDDKDRIYAEYQDELALLRKLPNDFLPALREIMAWRNADNSYLVDVTGIDKADVSRYLSGKKGLTPIMLTKILLALHSPPQINEYILELAPKRFDLQNEEHRCYRFLLQYCAKYSYNEAMEEMSRILYG